MRQNKYIFSKTYNNIVERKFIGNCLLFLKPFINISTKDWAEKYRVLTSEESAIIGKFDCMRTPWMLFLMECLDNPNIPVIVGKKSAQIAWTETLNNYRGKRIHTKPCKMLLAFPRLESAKLFYKEKWKPFYTKTEVLKERININVAKEGFSFFTFPGGFLKFITASSVGATKSSSLPYIEVEEPDDLKADVAGQGDSLELLRERQKTFKNYQKKLIFGGTPTDKDFSRVDEAYNQSNMMEYRVPCHECGEFHVLSFDNLKVDEYPNRYIDEVYGIHNPKSAYYVCPICSCLWTFEQKNINVLEAIKYHNKGWYITKPEIDIYGFAFNELLSPFEASNFEALAEKRIKAQIALSRGNEGPMKSFVNNSMGLAYSSGVTALEVDEMKNFRTNYPENVLPLGSSILTMGIDVQDNRFAYVILAWGRGHRVWLVKWAEIFGTVTNYDDVIWRDLEEICITPISHILSNKKINISAISIDSGDNTELVYRFVSEMGLKYPNLPIFATKGVKNLSNLADEIYNEPVNLYNTTDTSIRKTVAETMGVPVHILGAHKAHAEIIRKIKLNANKNNINDVFYFNETSYGQFEEQMLSCSKITDIASNKSMFKLKPGKRKEAMDACKNAFHAAYALGIRNMTTDHWRELEHYVEAK